MSSAMLNFSTPVQILSFAAANDFHEKQLQSDEACYVMEVLQNVRPIVLPRCISEIFNRNSTDYAPIKMPKGGAT